LPRRQSIRPSGDRNRTPSNRTWGPFRNPPFLHGSDSGQAERALDFGHDAVAPELACVTARYAALAPFRNVAVLLSELPPISGAQNVGAVRNGRSGWARTLFTIETAKQAATPPAASVVVGLDGGYVRGRHRHEERQFEVIAGKVIDADGTQHRFAFAHNGQAASAEAFAQALSAAGVDADTPATVLCDGDAGLWRLQREALPAAMLVLDWWHIAMRFEHAGQGRFGSGGRRRLSSRWDDVRHINTFNTNSFHRRSTWQSRHEFSRWAETRHHLPRKRAAADNRAETRHYQDGEGIPDSDEGSSVVRAGQRICSGAKGSCEQSRSSTGEP
jgi:hypothetical protein